MIAKLHFSIVSMYISIHVDIVSYYNGFEEDASLNLTHIIIMQILHVIRCTCMHLPNVFTSVYQ